MMETLAVETDVQVPQRFQGRNVLVTGAAQGIGAAITAQLLKEGAFVVALDRNADQLAQLAATLAPWAARLCVRTLDICDGAQVARSVAAIEEERPLHGLVNCAGVLRPRSVADTTLEDWMDTFAVNTHGTFFVTQAVAMRMAARGEGAVVTVASNAGSTPRVGMAAYCASKAAAAMLTRCIGLELGAQGVRCNVVSPGSTQTPMLRTLVGDRPGIDREIIAGNPSLYRTGIPLGRLAVPDDIARGVLFLLSGDARHITMQDLVMDGGATCA